MEQMCESTDNVEAVQSSLTKIIKCHDEDNEMHEDVINLVCQRMNVRGKLNIFKQKGSSCKISHTLRR